MVLDPEEESSYIEDCEVCCRPVELYVQWRGERLIAFEGKRMAGI